MYYIYIYRERENIDRRAAGRSARARLGGICAGPDMYIITIVCNSDNNNHSNNNNHNNNNKTVVRKYHRRSGNQS